MQEGPDKVAVDVVRVLEAAHVPCAIGGAIALGFWAGPRGTRDVDLTAFVDEEQYAELLDILQAFGCQFDREQCLRDAQSGHAMVLQKDGWHIDLFVPSIPFYTEAQKRIERVLLRDMEVPVLSAESLSVFKLLFFRRKDLVDLERLIALQGAKLDHPWVRDQIVGMLGEDDPRVVEWDRMIRIHGTPSEVKE